MQSETHWNRVSDSIRSDDGVNLWPLVPVKTLGLNLGRWSISDKILIQIWRELCKDNLQYILFPGGGVKEKTWPNYIKSTKAVFLIAGGRLAGGAWLTRINGYSASPHFFFLKWTWGPLAEHMGYRILEYWFSWPRDDGKPLLEILEGRVPVFNRRAIRYAKNLGFTEIGQIPRIYGKGMSILYLENPYA